MDNETIVDAYGRIHILKEVLSTGGQGVVYRTDDPHIIIKISYDEATKARIINPKGNEKFKYIKLLPLLEKTNIIMPIVTLKEIEGYAMYTLEDMDSVNKVFSKADELLTSDWLEKVKATNLKLGELLETYASTGGIKKRLEVFLNAAIILSKLHVTGLVYCDLSEKNIFVSIKKEKSNAWLIDCDNLDFMTETAEKTPWLTPGYGAPEIIQGNPNTIYSDDFSFAITFFLVLTKELHPFVGEAVNEAMDSEFGDKFIEEVPSSFALNHDFPWIGDEDDSTNADSTGFPYDMIISKEMMKYFDKTFSRLGKDNPSRRTTAPIWAYVIAKDIDVTCRCSNCNMDYNARDNEICPWCDHKDRIIHIVSYEEGKKATVWEYKNIISTNLEPVSLRILKGFSSDEVYRTAFYVAIDGDKLIVSRLNDNYEFSIIRGAEAQEVYGTLYLSGGQSYTIQAIERYTKKKCVLQIEV